MPPSKKSTTAKKSEPEAKKETPKKEEPKKLAPKKDSPKKEAPKKAAHTSFASLKKEYFAALGANPSDAAKLKAQYIKARNSLRGTLKSNK